MNRLFLKSLLIQTGQRVGLAGALFLLVVLGVAPAWAQQTMEDRLNRLENDLQTISRALYRGENLPPLKSSASTGDAVGGKAQAGMELRLSQLEMEIRTLTGAIEQQNFQIRQMKAEIDRTLADMEMRLAEIESGTAAGKTALSDGGNNKAVEVLNNSSSSLRQGLDTQYIPPSVSSGTAQGSINPSPVETNTMLEYPATGEYVPDSGLPENPVQGTLGTLVQTQDGEAVATPVDESSPAALYETAFTLLRDKSYEKAEEGFSRFLELYPAHMLAANATYWLGETYYVRNDYERAARVFAEAYQSYPKGSKGPDSLLKLAMSLAGMGKKDDACLAYARIKQEYSHGAGPVLTRAEQEMNDLGCAP